MIEIDIIKPLYTADGIINLKVNKKINKGDFLTLFGKSGSGKTTLLRILSGLLNFEASQMEVLNLNLSSNIQIIQEQIEI